MALNIDEQIAALEEQLVLVKGKGSAAKKKSIQKEIDELEAANVPDESPEETEPLGESGEVDIPEEEKVKIIVAQGWQSVTMAQVLSAEKAGLLVGFDSDKMIALIK